MKRYIMISTPGGYREAEAEMGTWVRYKDVADLFDEFCIDDESVAHAEKLMGKRRKQARIAI